MFQKTRARIVKTIESRLGKIDILDSGCPMNNPDYQCGRMELAVKRSVYKGHPIRVAEHLASNELFVYQQMNDSRWLPRLYDHCLNDSEAVLFMELMGGEMMSDLLERGQQLSHQEILSQAIQIVS